MIAAHEYRRTNTGARRAPAVCAGGVRGTWPIAHLARSPFTGEPNLLVEVLCRQVNGRSMVRAGNVPLWVPDAEVGPDVPVNPSQPA